MGINLSGYLTAQRAVKKATSLSNNYRMRRRVVFRVNNTASQGAGSRAKVFVRSFYASIIARERISSMRYNR